MTCELVEQKLREAQELLAKQTNDAIKSGLIEMSVAGFAVPSLIMGNTQVFPSVRSTNTGFNNSTAAAHDINLPSSYNAGDLLIIVCASQNNCTATWNTPSGWTAMPTLNNAQNGATQGAVGVFYKVATGSEGSTVNVALSASTWRAAWVSYAIYNYTGTPEAAKSADSGASTTVDPPAVSPTGATASTKYLFLTLGAWTHSNNATDDPDNYTNAIQGQGSTATGATVRSLRKEVTGTTDNPNTFTITSSRWAAGTISIKGAGGPGNASRILDTYSNVTGAWSISRQLLSSWTSSRYTPDVGISEIADQTGNSRHLVHATGANQPTLQTGLGPQSRAGARFDGSNDQLTTNAVASSSLISASAAYVVACFILRVLDTNSGTVSSNDTVWTAGGSAGLTFQNVSGTIGGRAYNNDGSEDSVVNGVGLLADFIDYVFIYEFRHESGNIYSRLSRTGLGTTAWTGAAASGDTAPLTGPLRIGSNNTVFTQLDFLEAVTFNAVPNDTLKDALVSNMLAHYG